MAVRKPSRRKPVKWSKRRKAPARSTGRSLNEILMELGRQTLVEGVREVLEEHGIDSNVKVDMVLTKPRPARRTSKSRSQRRR